MTRAATRTRWSYGRRAAGLTVAVVVGAFAAGCGVPLQRNAEPVQGVVTSTPGSSATPTGRTVELWFVRDGRLVPYDSGAPDPLTVESLVDALATGPSGPDPGVRSLLLDPGGSGALVTIPDPARGSAPEGTVTVQLSDAFAALPPTEQLLLLGQVVLTLTDAGADAVVVTDTQGAPVSVPLPDGRVLEGPVTRSDYAPLTAQPSPSPG